MSFKLAVLALGFSVLALCISLDSHAKGGRYGGGSRSHHTSQNKHNVNSQKSKPKADEQKQGDTHIHNYGNSGNSGNASSSMMPMIAGAAVGYTAANMLSDKDSDKSSDKDIDKDANHEVK